VQAVAALLVAVRLVLVLHRLLRCLLLRARSLPHERGQRGAGNGDGGLRLSIEEARRDQGQADSGRANQDGTTSGTIAGTPQQVLEQYENIKNELGAQGLFPHLYFGAMPQDEAYRNLMLFAKKCLPEIKSWRADTTIDQPLRAAAE